MRGYGKILIWAVAMNITYLLAVLDNFGQIAQIFIKMCEGLSGCSQIPTLVDSDATGQCLDKRVLSNTKGCSYKNICSYLELGPSASVWGVHITSVRECSLLGKWQSINRSIHILTRLQGFKYNTSLVSRNPKLLETRQKQYYLPKTTAPVTNT